MKQTLFTSAPMTIGKTQWRIEVFESDEYWFCNGEVMRFTTYKFFDGSEWKREKYHPKYNGNDTYNGLPKTLAKLYHANIQTIESLLHPENVPAQPALL